MPYFLLIDMSGSMNGNRIAAVNTAMNKLWPLLREISVKEPELDIQVRAITFGKNGAQWKVGSRAQGVSGENFSWTDIPTYEPDGGTPTEEAVEMLLSCVEDDVYREYLGPRFAIPLFILISDGESNRPDALVAAIDKLRATRVGAAAVYVSVGIETTGNQRAATEMGYFGRNGFRDCTDALLNKLADLVQTATYNTANANKTPGVTGADIGDVLDEDDFDAQ